MTQKTQEDIRIYVLQFRNTHGIYKIINKINGKYYIGSAVNLYERWYKHKSDLNKNKHDNSYLQNAWNKYGEENFTFVVLELIDNKIELINREQYWIDILDATNRSLAYNLAPKAGSMLGFKHSEETKRKISKNRKGIKIPLEAQKRSAETRRGMKRSIEFKEKMSKIKQGFRHSKETKRKISEIQIGKKREPRSEEVKAKISQANKGRTDMPKGQDVYNSLFNNEQIREIKIKMANGAKNKELADEYSVSNDTISDIRYGRTYSNIASDIDLSHTYDKRLKREDVIVIRSLLEDGRSIEEIARNYNKSKKTILQIKNRETWKDV